MDEEAFLLAIAANPEDTLAPLVYADWLDEQSDPGGRCLRYWVKLTSAPFCETAYLTQRRLLDGYRLALNDTDPEWVELVERARPWLTKGLAELAARLYLRAIEGRKLESQWIDTPYPAGSEGWWHVPYWPNNPVLLRHGKRASLSKRRILRVEPITAMVSLRPPLFGRPPDQTV